jgi:hypothetical protein
MGAGLSLNITFLPGDEVIVKSTGKQFVVASVRRLGKNLF